MIATERAVSLRDDDLDIVSIVRMLWSYKYMIVLAGVLCAIIAAAVALLMTPIFRAEAMVTEVKDPGMDNMASLAKKLGGLADVAGVGLGAGSGQSAESQAILHSRHLVEEFIRRNNLQSHFAKHVTQAQPARRLWFAVKDFQNNVLSIRDDKRAGTTAVAIEWTDPALAAQWANEVVALANELIRNRAIDESKRSIDYLTNQAAQTNVVEVQRAMYNLIETETKKLTLANARAEYAFTVVDPAVQPELRLRPRRTLMVLVGFALGLVLGVLVAFVHHSLSGRGLVAGAVS